MQCATFSEPKKKKGPHSRRKPDARSLGVLVALPVAESQANQFLSAHAPAASLAASISSSVSVVASAFATLSAISAAASFAGVVGTGMV